MNEANRSNIKDVMYQFLQEPTRENFSSLILNETGEQNAVDFKERWTKDQQIAKTILGIANTSPGAIIFGIEEKDDGTVNSCGLTELVDKSDIQKKLSNYLPENLKFEIYNFDYSGEEYSKFKGKKFQVIVVNPNDYELPYVCKRTSDDLSEGFIYVRRGTNNCLANDVEVESLLNKRIATMYSTKSQLELVEHLAQLKILYNHIDKYRTVYAGNLLKSLSSAINSAMGMTKKENPSYPAESYEEFIARMITEKKIKIERVLDLK